MFAPFSHAAQPAPARNNENENGILAQGHMVAQVIAADALSTDELLGILCESLCETSKRKSAEQPERETEQAFLYILLARLRRDAQLSTQWQRVEAPRTAPEDMLAPRFDDEGQWKQPPTHWAPVMANASCAEAIWGALTKLDILTRAASALSVATDLESEAAASMLELEPDDYRDRVRAGQLAMWRALDRAPRASKADSSEANTPLSSQ